MPLHLHIVEIYAEGCERVSERFVPPRQSAQSLGGVRLHGVVRLTAAAHRAAQLSGRSHGQAPHLWHAEPVYKKPNRHQMTPHVAVFKGKSEFSQGRTCDAYESQRIPQQPQTRWLQRGWPVLSVTAPGIRSHLSAGQWTRLMELPVTAGRCVNMYCILMYEIHTYV